MQVKQLFALSALVIAAGSVMADQLPGNGAPLTRAQVNQSVLDARAAGQLRAAGEAGDEAPSDLSSFHSSLSRQDVERQVVAARAAGELVPAGEADDEFVWTPAVGSGMTRAQVVAQTIQARDAGELIPAGQGDLYDNSREQNQHQYAIAHAHHAAPAATVTQ